MALIQSILVTLLFYVWLACLYNTYVNFKQLLYYFNFENNIIDIMLYNIIFRICFEYLNYWKFQDEKFLQN